MQRAVKATNVVLILLCAMYFISYIVRQSISTQMLEIRPEFGLSATDVGFVFCAIRRCSWSTRSQASPRSISAWTNGAWTSRSRVRRRA